MTAFSIYNHSKLGFKMPLKRENQQFFVLADFRAA
jgi:hypothetical protein